MAKIIVNEISYELDEDGFLEEASDWNKDVAKALARREKVEELTEEHWKVINYLRNYYDEFGVPPMVRKFLKDIGHDKKTIRELFPTGPEKGAYRIAGLPKPTGCI